MSTFAVVVAIFCGLTLLVVTGIYNGLVRASNKVDESWSGIDVQITRRHNLIPNLVNTVQGYAKHERGILNDVTYARSAAQAAQMKGTSKAAKAEAVLTESLQKLFALAENYPDLKASTNFVELQRELANTENQIAAARRIYNSNVQFYNAKLQLFPNNLLVRATKRFQPRFFFELQDHAQTEVPKVTFSQ